MASNVVDVLAGAVLAVGRAGDEAVVMAAPGLSRAATQRGWGEQGVDLGLQGEEGDLYPRRRPPDGCRDGTAVLVRAMCATAWRPSPHCSEVGDECGGGIAWPSGDPRQVRRLVFS